MFITDVITLDPAVISNKHSSAIEDNFITSAKPSTVQPYAGTGMTISNSSTNWGTSKAFERNAARSNRAGIAKKPAFEAKSC